MDLLEQSTRIALTAFLHDLGKLAERAGIEHGGRLDGNKQTYCPWRALAPNSTSGYHSHVHAAYTVISEDVHAPFSTGRTYSLLQLAARTESAHPEDAIWASQLHYRLARFYLDRVRGGAHAKDKREALLRDALAEIGGALRTHRTGYRLPLLALLYRQRD